MALSGSGGCRGQAHAAVRLALASTRPQRPRAAVRVRVYESGTPSVLVAEDGVRSDGPDYTDRRHGDRGRRDLEAERPGTELREHAAGRTDGRDARSGGSAEAGN